MQYPRRKRTKSKQRKYNSPRSDASKFRTLEQRLATINSKQRDPKDRPKVKDTFSLGGNAFNSVGRKYRRCHSGKSHAYSYGEVTNLRPIPRLEVASPAASRLEPAGTDSNPQPKPSSLDVLAVLNDLTIVKKIVELHEKLCSMETRQVSTESKQDCEAQFLNQKVNTIFSILNSMSDSICVLETAQMPILLGSTIPSDQIPVHTKRPRDLPRIETRELLRRRKTTAACTIRRHFRKYIIQCRRHFHLSQIRLVASTRRRCQRKKTAAVRTIQRCV